MEPNRMPDNAPRLNGDGQHVLPPLALPLADLPPPRPDTMYQVHNLPYEFTRALPPLDTAVTADSSIASAFGKNNYRPHIPVDGYHSGSSSAHPHPLSRYTHENDPSPGYMHSHSQDFHQRLQFNQLLALEGVGSMPMQSKPRRLPFRTESIMGCQSDPQEHRRTWGGSSGPRQVQRYMHPAPAYAASFHISSQGFPGVASYASSELNQVSDHQIDPAIARQARAHRSGVRRKMAALKNKRTGKDGRRCFTKAHPVSLTTSSAAAAAATAIEKAKHYRRRLKNRASVQKCRLNMRIRNQELHRERDERCEEQKFLLATKKFVEESGALLLLISDNLVKTGLVDKEDIGKNQAGGNSPLRPPAPGHAYHSNPNNGIEIQRIIRSKESSFQVQDNREDARLQRFNRRQIRASVCDGHRRGIISHDLVSMSRMESLLSVAGQRANVNEWQNTPRTGTRIGGNLDGGEGSSITVRGIDHDVPRPQLRSTGLLSKAVPDSRRDR